MRVVLYVIFTYFSNNQTCLLIRPRQPFPAPSIGHCANLGKYHFRLQSHRILYVISRKNIRLIPTRSDHQPLTNNITTTYYFSKSGHLNHTLYHSTSLILIIIYPGYILHFLFIVFTHHLPAFISCFQYFFAPLRHPYLLRRFQNINFLQQK